MSRSRHQPSVESPARTTPGDGRLLAPKPPEDAPAGSFPILASLAPVLGSVVLFAITRSPVTLVFAALGPLIAIAGFVDARWTRRRRAGRAAAEYRAAATRLEEEIDEAHAVERACLDRQHPSGRSLGVLAGADRGRWRVPAERLTLVVLGRGEIASTLRIDGTGEEGRWAHARRLDDAPVVIDAADGIGIVGGPALARAVGRNVLLQLARQLPPQQAVFLAGGGASPRSEPWAALGGLPHRDGPARTPGAEAQDGERTHVTVVERWSDAPSSRGDSGHRPGAGGVLLALSDAVELIPTRCRHLLVLGADGETILADGTGARESVLLRPGLLSDAEADRFALTLAEAASSSGESNTGSRIPSEVRLAQLRSGVRDEESEHTGWRSQALRVAVGRTADAPFLLDLAGDGPHAIVGGTTGSGKSELLITWITALAWRCSPVELSFLLIDCKGGASFQAVEALPHVVGMVTDLEPAAAVRVVSSLRAELRYRERILAAHGARHLLDPVLAPEHRPARLVVVVDEFQALLDASPHLHQVFADLAARGRSLGLHLILCSQRPAAVAADAILANCTLRLSLRVTSRQDSSAIIGVPDAAALPASAAGRCIVWDGSTRIEFQAAVADPVDLAAVRDRWRGAPVPRRPWLDPLPAQLSAVALRSIVRETVLATGALEPEDGTEIVFGLADLPDQQEQRPAVWRPARDGSLLVLGAGRSGRTTFLDTVEQAATGRWQVERVGHDPEQAWDTIVALADPLRPTPPTILLVDDVESMLATAGDEHADAIRATLLGLLRDGGRRELRVVLVASRIAGVIHRLAAQTDRTLVLRLADRQEHLVAGAPASCFDPRRPPGRAYWDEVEVQIAVPEARPVGRAAPTAPRAWCPEPGTTTILITRAARAARALVQSHVGSGGGVHLVEPAVEPWTAIGLSGGFRPAEPDRPAPGATVVLVDPETWLSGRLVAGRELPNSAAGADLVMHGCSAADFRQITRSRELPPLLGYGSARAWWWRPGHEARRVELFGDGAGRSRGLGSDRGDADPADDR
ncbi:hypothetical protein KXS11_13775 [Plantibacter flavus]|uniref:FtsK/SpoIIIE domain-containing protein n=1 Tax=Plantibacter flavus TaxID=150123 RepID=UPI003F17EC78